MIYRLLTSALVGAGCRWIIEFAVGGVVFLLSVRELGMARDDAG